jgi:uncharacterized protein YdcH (DUF465 family)
MEKTVDSVALQGVATPVLQSRFSCVTVRVSPIQVILNPQKEDVMMKEEEIKEHLMSSSADFRRLAEEHHQQETKLQELLSHSHLSEQDHLDQINLKKRKLQLKDQMNSMVLKFKNELSHQPT